VELLLFLQQSGVSKLVASMFTGYYTNTGSLPTLFKTKKN